MNPSGLNQGTSGNLSHRVDGGFLITPTGMDYDALRPEDLVLMRFDGEPRGPAAALLRVALPPGHPRLAARGERGAAHALACTAPPSRACAAGIPAFHYMVAVAGGTDIRCAPYATFGTQELSGNAVAALEGRKACLLANHGLIAVGADLPSAFKLAVEVETLAPMYLRALQAGRARAARRRRDGRRAGEVQDLRPAEGVSGLRKPALAVPHR